MIQEILLTIQKYPAIPVFYHDNQLTCIAVLEACYKGGIRVFEFVNRGPEAPANFHALLTHKRQFFPDLKLGIGTIKTAEQAEQFLHLGAEFIVSPIVNESIAKITSEKHVLWIPGCMTPTEIALAESLQAPFIKLFPGDNLGPKFLKAIKPLFPQIRFMPTGGVEVEKSNLDAWFDAGAFSVGLGSKLFNAPDEISTDYDWLTDRCQHLMSIISSR